MLYPDKLLNHLMKVSTFTAYVTCGHELSVLNYYTYVSIMFQKEKIMLNMPNVLEPQLLVDMNNFQTKLILTFRLLLLLPFALHPSYRARWSV